MTEDKVEIEHDGTRIEALLLRPDRLARFPGVLFYTDIWGIRPANIGMARRLADKGFAVLMPNVFFRHAPIRPNGFEPASEDQRPQLLKTLFQSLTSAQMGPDGAAYARFLSQHDGVRPGKLGTVGYCYTGAMAVHTAAAVPDVIAAAASFHGGMLVTEGADSPHRQLPRITARLYFGHAVEDGSMTGEQIAVLEQALRDWHGAFQSETYEGARHGWTVPGRDVYNELQAERAFETLVELFDATLKG